MNLNKKLLTLLAIFCVIASAGLVCAADYGGYAGSNYQDMNGVSGSQYDVDDEDAGLEPGAGLPLENQTGPMPVNTTDNMTGNVTGNETGNATGNATSNVTGNATGNTTGNFTAPHSLLATGNPIIALLAVSAVLGGAVLIRRK